MSLDRLDAQEQPVGDLLVREAFGQQSQHLLLAGGQRLDRDRQVAPVAPGEVIGDQRLGGGRGEERLAEHHLADRLDQVDVGRALEDVAGRAGLQRPEQVLRVVVHRQHQHLDLGRQPVDRARRVDAVHAGHRDVEQRDLGPQGEDALDALGAVAGLADHLEPRLGGQQRAQPAAQDRVVVADHDPGRHRSSDRSTPAAPASQLTLAALERGAIG
jgi:hypothetical protein